MYHRVVLALASFSLYNCSDSAAVMLAANTEQSRLEEAVEIARVPNPPKDLGALPGDLRLAPIPGPTNLTEFIRDRDAALVLGKALFWDMQVGSDHVQACASCHFRAGADPRSKNQMSPAHTAASGRGTFTKGANYQLTESDFPLTRLAVPGVRGALDPATDNPNIVSSQGVHYLRDDVADPNGFEVAGVKVRRVEPRNTPSMINAVFNHRQFWDGRAENVFNGVNHLGDRDTNARVARADSFSGTPALVRVQLPDSSLASQALAPILSDTEMADPGRTKGQVARHLAKMSRQLGKRVDWVRPLAKQIVHPNDSVLGSRSRYPQPGLKDASYEILIAKAFQTRWWLSRKLVQVSPDGSVAFVDKADSDPKTEEYTLLEYNFALFFGLAVQLYEATLISDDTPWDKFRRQHPTATDPALNPWTNTNPDYISRQALFGAHLFNDRTRGATNIRCSNCHENAELTDASARRVKEAAFGPVRNRDGNVIDKGFNNIGLRPTSEDLGVGASDAFGPLSHTRRLFPTTPPATFDTNAAVVSKGFGVDGAFKVPSLRNVALTAPYFHNGDARTLREAVELYSRGGNVAPVQALDGTPIEPLGVPNLTPAEVDAIVAWLETLTDERVLYRRAPFDHPQLFVPNGHPGDHQQTADNDGDGYADDIFFEVNAVGAEGGAPLPGFLEGPFAPR